MANRMVLHIAGQKYNLVSNESADYMHEVAELARQTVAHCGGTLADDYIKAKSAAEAAEAKCRALEAELAALRDRQAQNNGKHPNHNRK